MGRLERRQARESWIVRRRALVLLILLSVATATRVVYFIQLNSTPLIALHRVPLLDTHVFDTWARAIAGGDWASATVGVPMHPWHREVARQFIADRPAEAAATAARAGRFAGDTESRIWRAWMNGAQFYQDPLYAYLIALTYVVAGPDARAVFVWQMALGVLSTFLVWSLTRRFFGDPAALAAGVLAVLAAPLIYYDLILLRESPLVFASLGVTWLTVRAFDDRRWPSFFALGAALAAATMLKSTCALFGIGVIAAILLPWRATPARWRLAAGAAAGALAMGAPLVVRNVSLGVSPLALSSSGPMIFAFANVPDYPAADGFFVDVQRLSAVMGDSQGDGSATVLATLDAHTPRSMATLFWRKIDLALNWREIPNNDNFYYFRRHAPILAWLPVTACVIVPLGLVGLAVAAPGWRERWPLYLLVAASVAPLLLFYVLGRFRVPLLAALVPFAGFTIASVTGWIRQRRWRPAAVAALAAAGLFAWCFRSGPAPPAAIIRPADWLLPFMIQYRQELEAARQARDASGAVATLREWFRYEPRDADILASGSKELARSIAELRRQHALALAALGRLDEARREHERARHVLSLTGG